MKIGKVLFICFVVLFQSCGNSNQENLEKEKFRKKDSIENIRQVQLLKEQKTKDSIINLEQDKVIGDIRFGMTEQEFEIQKDSFLKETEFVDYEFQGRKFYRSKIGTYQLSFIRGIYNNDSLYYTRIIGHPIHYEKYDSNLKKELQSIYNIFKNKYGTPQQDNVVPEWHQISNGQTYPVAKWIVGTKSIDINIVDGGVYRYIHVNIYRQDAVDQLRKEREFQEKNEENQATDLI